MRLIKKLRDFTQTVIDSSRFVPIVCAVTAVMMLAGQTVPIGLALVVLSAWLLAFSDDTLMALFPILFDVVVVTVFCSGYFYLFRFAFILAFYIPALLIHLIAYRGSFTAGRFLPSLLAVSAALIVGGAGTIPAAEYFSGTSMFYVIGLGLALVLVYLLLCSRLSRRRNYDLVGRFASIMYCMAVLAGVLVAVFYLQNLDKFANGFHTPFIPYRNFCTTVMLFGMPMACYFMKNDHRHLAGLLGIFVFMLFAGSRSGLLFGSFELALCLGYVYYRYPHNRAFYRRVALYGFIPALVAGGLIVYLLFLGDSGRVGETFVRPTEARTRFYPQGVRDFLSKPLLGYGIGNMKNADIWLGTEGSIVFYHNSTLQVMASMGLVGCAAYGLQLYQRLHLLWLKRRTDAFLMLIPFIGILLMSQTNPGSFCPLPTGVLLVTMFAVVEFENLEQTAPVTARIPALVTGKVAPAPATYATFKDK